MKFSNLTKLVSVGALSLGLSVLPVVHSASAQDTTTVPDTTADTTPAADVESNDGFDWGWLGLLGLIGLAGLSGKKHHDDTNVRYVDPNVTRTGTSYRE
jgi:hypothetical protein